MSKERYNQIFDEKVKAAGLRYLEKIADDCSAEELKEYYVPTETLDERVKASINKLKYKKSFRGVLRVVSITAACIILLIGISCLKITNTEALRIKFSDIFLFKTTGMVELSAPSELDTETMPDGADFINPGYMPEGSELCEAVITVNSVTNTYLNKDNTMVRISRSQTVGSIAFDNENTNHYERQIKGNRAIIVETSSNSMLYYFSNNYFYDIIGDGVAANELIKIAENLPK